MEGTLVREEVKVGLRSYLKIGPMERVYTVAVTIIENKQEFTATQQIEPGQVRAAYKMAHQRARVRRHRYLRALTAGDYSDRIPVH